jgi:hypothetical protein
MSSLWDSFAQKIHGGNIQIEEVVELIEFLEEFDVVNNNIIKDLMSHQLKFVHHDFIDLELFRLYIQTGSVHRVVLEYFISALHDFDHANEQVLMYTFDKNKHYWAKHHTYKNWMGVFKEGKWKYSKQYNEIHNERVIKNDVS